MKQTTALEAALKGTVPKPAAPPALHGQIMSALRASRCGANPQKRLAPTDVGGYGGLARWVGAAALVALLATGFWLARRHPTTTQPPSMVVPAATPEMGEATPQTLPVAVLEPLSKELESLNRDVDQAAKFVLASVP